MSLRPIWIPVLVAITLLVGCDEPTRPRTDAKALVDPSPFTNRLTVNSSWSDEVYDELTAADPGTTFDALINECPHLDGITRPLKLGVSVGEPPDDHITSFTFDGHKKFVAYEKRGTLTEPAIGVFGPIPATLSEDLRYIASGLLRVSCKGHYIRGGGLRTYTGTYLTLSISEVEESNLFGPGDTQCQSTADYQYIYDPYYQECPGTTGSGSGSDGNSTSDLNCTDEYIYIEISYDDGRTWRVWWEGWARVCTG